MHQAHGLKLKLYLMPQPHVRLVMHLLEFQPDLVIQMEIGEQLLINVKPFIALRYLIFFHEKSIETKAWKINKIGYLRKCKLDNISGLESIIFWNMPIWLCRSTTKKLHFKWKLEFDCYQSLHCCFGKSSHKIH